MKELRPQEKYRRLLLVERALGEFNFKRVADTMKMLEWRWSRNGRFFIPSEREIMDEARNLATKLILSNEFLSTSTGGLTVKTDKKRSFMYVAFVLEESSSDMDDLDYAVGEI